MKEHPILFSTPMVKAILDGTKTQTRRVIKYPSFGKYKSNESDWDVVVEGSKVFITSKDGIVFDTKCGRHSKGMQDRLIICPYGQVGDTLWVRETYGVLDYDQSLIYKADCDDEGLDVANDLLKWRPSIHMPRWASRITLKIKSINVERVQDITEADAIAEGVYSDSGFGIFDISARVLFKSLWNSINSKRGYGWDVNPWVWVIEFEVWVIEFERIK